MTFPCVYFANKMQISITFCKTIYLNQFCSVHYLYKSTVFCLKIYNHRAVDEYLLSVSEESGNDRRVLSEYV